MNEPRDGTREPSADTESLFRLGPHRPFATITLILVFLAMCGFAFGALFGTDVEVQPFVPEETDRVSGDALASIGGAPALGSALGLPVLLSGIAAGPTGAGATAQSPVGEAPEGIERFGPEDAGVVIVPVGWAVTNLGDVIIVTNGAGVRFSARILTVTTATQSTQLVAEAQAEILSTSLAAHVRTSDIVELQPFASLVTTSLVGYSAIRTDAQGTVSVAGNTFVYVRADGLSLVVNVEVTPAGAWDPTPSAGWFPLWLSVVTNFAGGSPLS